MDAIRQSMRLGCAIWPLTALNTLAAAHITCPGSDEIVLDCNGNGTDDYCDITAFGTSPDANTNGVPDECDFTQCRDPWFGFDPFPLLAMNGIDLDDDGIAWNNPSFTWLTGSGGCPYPGRGVNGVSRSPPAADYMETEFFTPIVGGLLAAVAHEYSLTFDLRTEASLSGRIDWQIMVRDATNGADVLLIHLASTRSSFPGVTTAQGGNGRGRVLVQGPGGSGGFLNTGFVIPLSTCYHIEAKLDNNAPLASGVSVFVNGILRLTTARLDPAATRMDYLRVEQEVNGAPSPENRNRLALDNVTLCRRGAPPEWRDCNTNGAQDASDIAEGTSRDCNTNALPDECEPPWPLQAELEATYEGGYIGFGSSVALHGNLAVVGSRWWDVYVFRNSDGTWFQEAGLHGSDLAWNDTYGFCVAVGDDIVVVGAPHHSHAGVMWAGSAYVFRRRGTHWVQEAELLAAEAVESENFGSSAAVSGDLIVVGTGAFSSGGDDPVGAAYVFRYNAASPAGWVQEAKLTSPAPMLGDGFGFSVSISGDALLIGALSEGLGGTHYGAAHVFRRVFDPTAHWVHEARLISSVPSPHHWFGYAVSIDGDLAVVGATVDIPGYGSKSGRAFVYRHLATRQTWGEEALLVPSDPFPADQFGQSVAVSGDAVLVGAESNSSPPYQSGAAYLFRPSPTGWVQYAKLSPIDPQPWGYVGGSVSLDGSRALVGATGREAQTGLPGTALLFALEEDCNSNGVPDSCEVILPCARIVGAASWRSHGSGVGRDKLSISPAGSVSSGNVASESRMGGILELRLAFDSPPGGPGALPVTVAQRTCEDNSVYSAYTGAAVAYGAIDGYELVLTFSPPLENARTYRLRLGAEVSAVPNQFIEVRCLAGDVNSGGRVNAADRSRIVGVWTGAGYSPGTDITLDGRTDSTDRSVVVGIWMGTENCSP